MDGKIGQTAQGRVRVVAGFVRAVRVGDWRTRLQKHSRQRVVNKMMEKLKRNLPFAAQDELEELKKIAIRLEEKIYTEATSQQDYTRKVSSKMMSMEIKSQNPMTNLLQSNAAGNSKNPKDPASIDPPSQIGSATDEDWQEKTYQKIKAMHEMYYVELNKLYEGVADKIQQLDTIPQQSRKYPLENLRSLKRILERLVMFLQTNKDDIQPNHKDRIGAVEKQIENLLFPNRPRTRKAVSSMQRLPQPHIYHAKLQPRVSQTHTNEAQLISQMQQMNLQGSSLPTQQNNSTSLHYELWQLPQQLQGEQLTHQLQLIQLLMQRQQLGRSSQLQPQESQTHTNEGELISQMQQMTIQGSSLPTQQDNSTSLHNEQWQWQQQLQGQQLAQERRLFQLIMQKQQQQLQGQQLTDDPQQLIQLPMQKQQQQEQTPQLQPSQLHAQQQHSE